jgi:hypothetical protein
MAKARRKEKETELNNELNELRDSQQWHNQRQSELEVSVRGLEKKLGHVTKGAYVVVEGSENLEALYKELVADGKNGWGEFKNRCPGQLVKEVAEVLGLGLAKVPLREWSNAALEVKDSEQELQEESVKKLWGALAKPRALVNVNPQVKGKGKGKGKGKKGKGRGWGRGKGEAEKGGGKGERERKEGTFVLHLNHGERLYQVKSALEEVLEQALRKKVGLAADAAWARGASLEEDVEMGEAAKETQGKKEKTVEVKTPVEEVAATPPADTPPAEGAAAKAPTEEGNKRKRFLVWVEKTKEEQEAKKGKQGEKGGGKRDERPKGKGVNGGSVSASSGANGK